MVAKHYFLNYPSNHICTTKGKSLRFWHRHCCCQSVDYGIENYSARASIVPLHSQSQRLEIGIESCTVDLSESCSEVFSA